MGRLSKIRWFLLGCLIMLLLLVAGSVFVPYILTNAVKHIAENDFAGKLRLLSEQEPAKKGTLVEMVVDGVGISKVDYQPVVILKEKRGELRLTIWIGPLEANAISVVLEKVEVPRPLTPDLLCSILDKMGASVDYIIINDLKNNTFYANIGVNANWRHIKIDSRPSDAIAIALRRRVPIYVEKSVLDKAGIQPQPEADKRTVMHLEKRAELK
ncbi:bifunctional nuclease family protein [Chloroflexota bacterium]